MLVEQRVEGRWFRHNLKPCQILVVRSNCGENCPHWPLIQRWAVGDHEAAFCFVSMICSQICCIITYDAVLNPLHVNFNQFQVIYLIIYIYYEICVNKFKDPKMNRSI